MHIHIFRVPDDTERKNLWLEALEMDNANKWHYVCSEHFQSCDYDLTKTKTRI